MVFRVKSVEVLKRRNKPREPCVEDWKHYDRILIQQYINEAGCVAPFQRSERVTALCDTPEKMKEAQYPFTANEVLKYPPPCQSMEDFDYVYTERDLGGNGDTFSIQLKIPPVFKEIHQSKAIDIQVLIGNVGGYLGLFLGMFS